LSPQRRLPAEWQPQSGVLLTWPHKQTDFASELGRVETTFCIIASVISHYERLIICSSDDDHTLHIYHLLSQTSAILENITIYAVASNDSWARDHGPITIIENNKAILLDFKFNGWGNKYPSNLDDAINAKLASQGAFNAPLKSLGFVLEGGSIESDGQGILLTTTQCLLAETRNPMLAKTDIEHQLKQFLGIEKVLWLEHGKLIGDDTDGHIDMLARFINPETICHMRCDNPDDPHFTWLNQLKQELQTLKNLHGQAYQLIELPFPNAVYNDAGERLPASYCNFLIINNAVLLPVYNCPQDTQAIEVLTSCFPARKIIPIDCRTLVEQHGSLHCITMQFPTTVLDDVDC